MVPVRVYRRSLPHWRQDGATYFVTFRLADSVPAAKVREWQCQRTRWYAAHGLSRDLSPDEWGRRYHAVPARERSEFEQRAARQLLVELDRRHGACVLRNPGMVEEVGAALRFFDGKRYRCGDFVIMPNHVHWLVLPLPGHTLESVLGSIKQFTSRAINQGAGTVGSLWQRESHDRLVRDSRELARTRRYVAANPERGRVCPGRRVWRAGWLDGVESVTLDS